MNLCMRLCWCALDAFLLACECDFFVCVFGFHPACVCYAHMCFAC